MSWYAVGVAAVGLISSRQQGRKSRQAAGQAAGGQSEGIAELRRQFDINRQDLLPFLEAGQEAVGAFRTGLDEAPAAFQFDPQEALNNPSLDFLREEGARQLARSTAKNRNLGSTNRLFRAEQFGQGLASQELDKEFNRQLIQNQSLNNRFNERLNRLAGLVNVGSRTGNALGTTGANAANNIATLQGNRANLLAAGTLGQSNAQAGGLNNLAGLFGALEGSGIFGGGGGGIDTSANFDPSKFEGIF